MALVSVPTAGADPRIRQQLAAQLIAGAIGEFGQLRKQQLERQALADILGGRAAETPTAAQLDPTQMTPGSAAGTLAAPATPGLLPGMSPEMAGSYVTAGMGPQLAQVGLERAYPGPVDPVAVREGGALVDPATGVVVYQSPGVVEPPKTRDVLQGQERVFQEFDAATGTWREVGRGSAFAPPATTTIKVPPQFPPAPSGYHYEGNIAGGEARLVRTPGGPAEAEAQDREAQAAAKQAASERQLRVVQRETNRVLDIIDDPDWTSGLVGRGLAQVPGTEAYQAQQSLNSLGAIISFDVLQRMRDASPTGGALGSITEGEIQRLQAVHGSLDIAQDPDILAENITEFERTLDEIVNGPGGAPQESVNLGSGERTAINPQTGERLVLRNGDWVPQ